MNDPHPVVTPLLTWLSSRSKKGEPSRSTIAIGIVLLDKLRDECPVRLEDVTSSKGEIKGARGTKFTTTLEKYQIPVKFLKEVTTRGGGDDGRTLLESLDFGKALEKFTEYERDCLLVEGIEELRKYANRWLARENIKVTCERHLTPEEWINRILDNSQGRSGGKVEQHLVGAKLQCRHSDVEVENNPGHAGDVQTGRSGDFTIGTTVFHVTGNPSLSLIEKCEVNCENGLHPVVLVPRIQTAKARNLAEEKHLDARITVCSLEEFVSINVIEMSVGDRAQFYSTFAKIIAEYNKRLEAVETDLSLKIDIK